jgi:hypothetical protein
MPRGNTDLTSSDYDAYLTEKSKNSRGARQELAQRHSERRNAHDQDGRGYHFGLGAQVVKVESKEHLKHELYKRGLMLETDVDKNLRGPGKHEYGGRK